MATEVGNLGLRVGVRVGIGLVLWPVVLLGLAGDWRWPAGWVWLGVMAGLVVFDGVVLLKVNPEVVRERMGWHKGAEWWDVALATTMGIIAIIGFVVAGLDHRFGWSGPVPAGWRVAGLVLFVAGDLLLVWAMAVNKYFSKIVRIQNDRGHEPVSAGPYRYVRHPGYVAAIVMFIPVPIALESWWGLAPMVISAVVLVIRTAAEDRTLRKKLPGYEQYAQRVRYRLVPGVW